VNENGNAVNSLFMIKSGVDDQGQFPAFIIIGHLVLIRKTGTYE